MEQQPTAADDRATQGEEFNTVRSRVDRSRKGCGVDFHNSRPEKLVRMSATALCHAGILGPVRSTDQLTGTNTKVASLVNHIKSVHVEDAAWALTLLLGKRRRRLITGRRLREILRDHGDLPEWLINDCHGQVGDSAETISLLWPCVKERIAPIHVDLPAIRGDRPLHWWMEILLPSIATLKEANQAEAVLALWQTTPDNEHFMINKLMTGGSCGRFHRIISRAPQAFEGESL